MFGKHHRLIYKVIFGRMTIKTAPYLLYVFTIFFSAIYGIGFFIYSWLYTLIPDLPISTFYIADNVHFQLILIASVTTTLILFGFFVDDILDAAGIKEQEERRQSKVFLFIEALMIVFFIYILGLMLFREGFYFLFNKVHIYSFILYIATSIVFLNTVVDRFEVSKPSTCKKRTIFVLLWIVILLPLILNIGRVISGKQLDDISIAGSALFTFLSLTMIYLNKMDKFGEGKDGFGK